MITTPGHSFSEKASILRTEGSSPRSLESELSGWKPHSGIRRHARRRRCHAIEGHWVVADSLIVTSVGHTDSGYCGVTKIGVKLGCSGGGGWLGWWGWSSLAPPSTCSTTNCWEFGIAAHWSGKESCLLSEAISRNLIQSLNRKPVSSLTAIMTRVVGITTTTCFCRFFPPNTSVSQREQAHHRCITTCVDRPQQNQHLFSSPPMVKNQNATLSQKNSLNELELTQHVRVVSILIINQQQIKANITIVTSQPEFSATNLSSLNACV